MYRFAISSFFVNQSIVLPFRHFTILPFHVSPLFCFLLFRHLTILPFHRFTVLPFRRFTVSPINVFWNSIALNNLDKAGRYLGKGNGIGIGITWEAYLRWETTGFRAKHGPGLRRPSCKERNKAAISNLNATKKGSDNENVHHRQTYGGISVSHSA